MLTPIKSEREEVESQKRISLPCLTKMMAPPLACVATRETIPDGEWMRSEGRAKNPRIRKEEDELRLDSWIRSTEWDEKKCSSSVPLARRSPVFH